MRPLSLHVQLAWTVIGQESLLTWMAFLACLSLASAQPIKLDLRAQLVQAQRRSGLTLLLVDKDGSICSLDFRTRTLCQLVGPGGGVKPYTRYSLYWSKKLLAGNAKEDRIFVAELGKRQVDWLTKDTGSYDICWSHKGDKLAYVTSVQGRRQEGVFVMDVPKRKDALVGDRADPSATPQWSADDCQIVYHTDNGEVVTVDLQVGQQKKVTEGAYPSWYPDGKSLVYHRDDQLWLCSLDGTNVRRLIRRNFWKSVLNEPVRFSPKGEFGVFLRGWTDLRFVEHADVVVVRTADLEEVTVFERPFGQRLPLTWGEVEEMRRK